MRLVLFAALTLFAGTAIAAPRLVVARGHWAAFDRGGSCEAMSRSGRVAREGQVQAQVALAFDRGGRRQGQLAVRLRRPVRAGSSVVLTIGEQPFGLVARGQNAWSKGPAQETAIIAAMRVNGGMRIDARDASGRRMVDWYPLDGAPTAIDAAAAACSRPR